MAGGSLPRKVEVAVLHPLFTRDDGRTSSVDRFPSYVLNGGVSHIGFTFEKPWELASGEWTVRVTLGRREIAAKRFTVTVPAAGTGSDCGSGA